MRRHTSRAGCRPTADPRCSRHRPPDTLNSYEAIVHAYIREFRPYAADEMAFFRDCRSLTEAVHIAALAKTPDGNRHRHQYRIPGAVLSRAARRLQSVSRELKRCRSFAELHDAVDASIRSIKGIGVLAVYDIATRIGAFRGLEPEVVYLHAGVADGARALGFRGATLDPSLLPRAFRALKPREIEDCLCIFANDLFQLRS